MYMAEEPISLSFAFWPRSNIGTDESAAQSGATLIRVIYLTQTHIHICGTTHREAVRTIFKGLWYDSASGGLEPQTYPTLSGYYVPPKPSKSTKMVNLKTKMDFLFQSTLFLIWSLFYFMFFFCTLFATKQICPIFRRCSFGIFFYYDTKFKLNIMHIHSKQCRKLV